MSSVWQAASTASDQEQESTRNQKLTFKQDGCEEMRKTAELSSNEQTHIYMAGCLQFINFLIASRLFYSIPWHYCCSQESPMFSPTTEGMTKTKSIHAAPCLLSATSLPLLILENTDTLFSWIPHHYHPRMLHKQLIVSLPTNSMRKAKASPLHWQQWSCL